MRLITHNMLRCNRKDVTLGYPLQITVGTLNVCLLNVCLYAPVVLACFVCIDCRIRIQCRIRQAFSPVTPLAQCCGSCKCSRAERAPLRFPLLFGLFITIKLLLSSEFSAAFLEDESMLRVLHNLLFDTHLIEGELVCPESGHRFPVTNGIPNMMYVVRAFISKWLINAFNCRLPEIDM